jgi:hypothetical protein
LPLTSVAILLTVVVPALNVLPDAGLDTIADNPQLSVPVTENVTTAVQLFILPFTVIFDGQLIAGAWLSVTVTVKPHVLVFPFTSVATLFTVVIPVLNVLPDEGLETTEAIPQLSVPLTLNVTTALQFPASVFWLMLFEHVITGVSLSVTVTVKLQELVLPLKSVATLLTVVAPTVKVLPDAGVDTIADILQLSVPVTLNVTTALQLPASVLCVILFEQVITGDWLSTTMTVVVQVEALPLTSVTVRITGLLPVLLHVNDDGTTFIAAIPHASELPLSTSPAWINALPVLSKVTVIAWHNTAGAVLSCTVTIAEQLAVLPQLSRTVKVTVLLPTLAQLKVPGDTVSDAIPQPLVLPPSTWEAVMPALPVLSNCTVTGWQTAAGGL